MREGGREREREGEGEGEGGRGRGREGGRGKEREGEGGRERGREEGGGRKGWEGERGQLRYRVWLSESAFSKYSSILPLFPSPLVSTAVTHLPFIPCKVIQLVNGLP